MPKAIIVGFSRPYIDRLQSLLKSCAYSFRSGWEIIFSQPPSSKHSLQFEINIKEFEKKLPNTDDSDGPHILACRSPKDDQRTRLTEITVPFFRLVWLNNRFFMRPQKEDLERAITAINDVLLLEEEWSKIVKPHDSRSPLLLPEKQFRAQGDNQSLWHHSTAADLSRIQSFPRKIEAFKSAHLRAKDNHQKVWVDEVGHIFDWHGEMHGVAPRPRCWKFSYLIPRGFHFDVTSGRSNVSMIGNDGTAVRGEYLNVDAHGYLI